MDEINELLELATEIQVNAKNEAEAVIEYTVLLQKIERISKTSNNLKDVCERLSAQIEEIVADELNHQIKLTQLYSDLTEINISED